MDHLQRLEWIALSLSLLVFVATAASSFITFANPDSRKHFPSRVVSDKTFYWNAAWPTDVRVEFMNPVRISLHKSCVVEKLSKEDELIEGFFCLNVPDTNLKCSKMNLTHRVSDVTQDGATVRVEFDPQLGINASMLDVPIHFQLPPHGSFCILTNRRGTVRSNNLFVLDLRRYFSKNVRIKELNMQLNAASNASFKCSSSKAIEHTLKTIDQPAIPMPFQWDVCTAATADECLQEKGRRSLTSLADFKEWPVQIRESGELYLPFVPSHLISQLQGKYLLCSFGRTPITYFSAPLNFTEEDRANASSPAESLSGQPLRSVLLFNASNYAVHVPCWMQTNVPLTNVTWLFREKGKREDESVVLTAAGRIMKEVTVARDGRSLTFTGPFSNRIAGLYTCVSTVGEESVYSSHLVMIRGPPRMAASVPKEKVVVSGEEIRVTCEYENPLAVEPGLLVCGVPLDRQRWGNLTNFRAGVNKLYQHVILPLHFTINVRVRNASKTYIYRSGPLEARRAQDAAVQGGPLANSHQITCVGRRNPFTVVKTVLLRVLPPPSIDRTFPTKVCHVKCTLACNVRALSFYEQHGIKVEVRWTSKLVTKKTSGVATAWSQWELSGPTYQLQASDSTQRKRIKCEVRLLANSSGSVLFSEATETADLELSMEAWPPEEQTPASNRMPTIITATVFAVVIVSSVAYFVVYRWKLRHRQTA